MSKCPKDTFVFVADALKRIIFSERNGESLNLFVEKKLKNDPNFQTVHITSNKVTIYSYSDC